MILPAIFVKVADSTIGHETMPNFWVTEQPNLNYGYSRSESKLDLEKRQKFIDFLVQQFRMMLEQHL